MELLGPLRYIIPLRNPTSRTTFRRVQFCSKSSWEEGELLAGRGFVNLVEILIPNSTGKPIPKQNRATVGKILCMRRPFHRSELPILL